MTTAKRKLFELPEPSTASVTDATLQAIGKTGVLRFDYFRDGTPYRSGFKFLGVIATRTCNERCCTAWHIAEAYDALCEVENSAWIDETRNQMPERYRSELNVRHFIIYLDSAGCFEILADSFENLREEVGSWESVKQSILI
jgi:hypothetical protein